MRSASVATVGARTRGRWAGIGLCALLPIGCSLLAPPDSELVGGMRAAGDAGTSAGATTNNGGSGASSGSIIAQGDITVKEAEKQLIIRALNDSHGSRTDAAKKLGMSRRTLHRKLHAYHLEGL